jgi:hypothetical protein
METRMVRPPPSTLHPPRPFAAVVAKGRFGSRQPEGSADAPVTLQPERRVPPAACVPCRNLGDAVSNQPGLR